MLDDGLGGMGWPHTIAEDKHRFDLKLAHVLFDGLEGGQVTVNPAQQSPIHNNSESTKNNDLNFELGTGTDVVRILGPLGIL